MMNKNKCATTNSATKKSQRPVEDTSTAPGNANSWTISQQTTSAKVANKCTPEITVTVLITVTTIA